MNILSLPFVTNVSLLLLQSYYKDKEEKTPEELATYNEKQKMKMRQCRAAQKEKGN